VADLCPIELGGPPVPVPQGRVNPTVPWRESAPEIDESWLKLRGSMYSDLRILLSNIPSAASPTASLYPRVSALTVGDSEETSLTTSEEQAARPVRATPQIRSLAANLVSNGVGAYEFMSKEPGWALMVARPLINTGIAGSIFHHFKEIRPNVIRSRPSGLHVK
jgi:hypothetical protein